MAPQQAIRFSELRSPRGESTQASGTDATNDAGMAPQASHTPARSAEDPQGDAEHTVMEQEGACGQCREGRVALTSTSGPVGAQEAVLGSGRARQPARSVQG